MHRGWFAAPGALALVLLIGLVAMAAYHAGGGGHEVVLTTGSTGETVHLWRGHGWRDGGGFFPFFFLFPLLSFFLVFLLFRALFWGGPRWQSYRGEGGPMHRRFEEWHREAHADDRTHAHDAAPPKSDE